MRLEKDSKIGMVGNPAIGAGIDLRTFGVTATTLEQAY